MANADLARLEQEVAEFDTVVDSTVALLSNLSTRLKEANDGNAKITAITDDLDARTRKLSEAVAANTVAADEKPTEDAPVEEVPPTA